MGEMFHITQVFHGSLTDDLLAAADALRTILTLSRKAGQIRCVRALIALSTYPHHPSSASSLALSLSRLNGAGNSFYTHHLEEASTILLPTAAPEHFHERGAIIRAGQPRLFNISQNAESCLSLNLTFIGKSAIHPSASSNIAIELDHFDFYYFCCIVK